MLTYYSSQRSSAKTFSSSNASSVSTPATDWKAKPSAKKHDSINTYAVSGNICGQGLQKYKNGTIRFSIMHDMPQSNGEVLKLVTDLVVFPKNGGREINVDTSLISKGRSVIVKGFRRPNCWTDKHGNLHQETNFVVTDIVDNS